MSQTKIEWCDMTLNPVWGCLNNCQYCYARKISKRFGAKFGVEDFKPTWIQSNYQKEFPKKPKRIFVNSMSDIEHWYTDWMQWTINKIKKYPQHTFMFLTKNPLVYKKYNFPENCWLGVTITGKNDDYHSDEVFKSNPGCIKFVSLEPILGNDFTIRSEIDWIILGLETGKRNIFIPDYKLNKLFVDDCKKFGIPIFMKNSMSKLYNNLIQEFPNE